MVIILLRSATGQVHAPWSALLLIPLPLIIWLLYKLLLAWLGHVLDTADSDSDKNGPE